MTRSLKIIVLLVEFFFLASGIAVAAEFKRLPEWDKALHDAKTEGKIVLAIPPATELRTALEPLLKQKFGLEAELVSAPGPKNASRIAAEKKAAVNYFDAIICGTGTAIGLGYDGMLEPIESFWVLPEVKDPNQWWGGHIWEDNLKSNKFLYSFLADRSEERRVGKECRSRWSRSYLQKKMKDWRCDALSGRSELGAVRIW